MQLFIEEYTSVLWQVHHSVHYVLLFFLCHHDQHHSGPGSLGAVRYVKDDLSKPRAHPKDTVIRD